MCIRETVYLCVYMHFTYVYIWIYVCECACVPACVFACACAYPWLATCLAMLQDPRSLIQCKQHMKAGTIRLVTLQRVHAKISTTINSQLKIILLHTLSFFESSAFKTDNGYTSGGCVYVCCFVWKRGQGRLGHGFKLLVPGNRHQNVSFLPTELRVNHLEQITDQYTEKIET